MIHIFFVPGMFGSMIEKALRSFTDIKNGGLEPVISDVGSCHTFQKQFHHLERLDHAVIDESITVTTPIYPTMKSDLDVLIASFFANRPNFQDDKKILIHAPDQKWAEINLICQYHKVAIELNHGLEIFTGGLDPSNVRQWNASYNDCIDMKRWEWREMFSIAYEGTTNKWIESPGFVTDDFFVITNQMIIENTKRSLEQIIDFCELKIIKPLENFVSLYRQRQQYILDEYQLIQQIVDHTIHNKAFSWKPLHIIAESLLQNHFRRKGYEWFCDGLDVLPTCSQDFAKLIYRQ